MDSNIAAGLIGVIGTLIGTFLGWGLNSLSKKKREEAEALLYLIGNSEPGYAYASGAKKQI